MAEVVKFVTDNGQAFLNFGDKSPVISKELIRLIKLTKKSREEEKGDSKNKNPIKKKRLQKKEEPKSKIALNDCIGKNLQKMAIK